MSGLEIRPATPEEIRLVRTSWLKGWSPRGRDMRRGTDNPRPVMRWGTGRRLSGWAARRYVSAFVESVATPETVLVAALRLESGGSEAVAWACRELVGAEDGPRAALLHYVYTLRDFRRRKFAQKLVSAVRAEAEHVGVELEATHINARGTALLESAR